MSLHCDTDRICQPLTASQADNLRYGRIGKPDMEAIIQSHRDYESLVHSGRLNKNKEDATERKTVF